LTDQDEASHAVPAEAAHHGMRQRARHELYQFLGITAYLYVSFLAVTLLKSGILHSVGISYLPAGFALGKAAIMAKFIMLGHALRVGNRHADRPLIWSTLHRSAAFLLLLIVLTVIEEVLVGLFHGKSAGAALAEMLGPNLAETAARIFVLLLILIPYFAFRALGDMLGEETLIRMFFVARGRLRWEPARKE